ncbi:Kinesin-like protein KIN-14Q, partial [Dissostichus eleginoides]
MDRPWWRCSGVQGAILGDNCSNSLTVDTSPTPPSEISWVSSSGSSGGLQFPQSSERMFLWAGSKADGKSDC